MPRTLTKVEFIDDEDGQATLELRCVLPEMLMVVASNTAMDSIVVELDRDSVGDLIETLAALRSLMEE